MDSIGILGCGWLGLPLGARLAQAGFHVRGSTTQPEKLSLIRSAGIQPYLLSFEPELLQNPYDFYDVEALIINLPPRNRNGIADFHKRQLSEIINLAQGNVRYILFISSTAVYPAQNKEVTEEDADLKCLSRGGVPLLEMEHLFVNHPAFVTTVIRFGGLYGPDRHPGRFLEGRKNLSGAFNPVNMIHLEDCIGIIETIISKNIWGETMNVCAPSSETRQSFYDQAAKELGIKPPAFSDQPAPYKKVNVDKLIRLTGYQFKD